MLIINVGIRCIVVCSIFSGNAQNWLIVRLVVMNLFILKYHSLILSSSWSKSGWKIAMQLPPLLPERLFCALPWCAAVICRKQADVCFPEMPKNESDASSEESVEEEEQSELDLFLSGLGLSDWAPLFTVSCTGNVLWQQQVITIGIWSCADFHVAFVILSYY